MSFLPSAAWPVVVTLVALAFLAVAGALFVGRLGGRGRFAILALHAATALCLCLAVLNPVLRRDDQPTGSHLAVAVDVSQSVQRAGRDWSAVRATIRGALEEVIAGLRPEVRRTSTASLVTFADGLRTAARKIPLADLPQALSRVSEDELPPAGASDLEAGLIEAARTLEKAGRGALVLVSDGHETEGDARAAVRDLARRGFAVHVTALGASSPEIGLYAADLPRQVEAETPTWTRLLLTNSSGRELPFDLTFRLAHGGDTRSPTLPGTGWLNLRQPLLFEDPGLRFLDLELEAAGGQRQTRRFFTYVSSPPRILSIGDDHRWTRALPEEKFLVDTSSPEGLAEGVELARYDAVVLHEVWSQRVAAHLERFADAVRSAQAGLLLVNGPQEGGPEAQTMLMSYDETPLEELLPVVNKPRPELAVPPPRQIVILIDTSGSMGGWRLLKAQQIMAAIIDRLRPVDRLHMIAFTGGAHPLISDLAMTGEGKREALGVAGSLRAGGGTNPNQALDLIRGRRFQNCGLFVITDGEFGAVSSRPDCEATVFAIGKREGNMPPVLKELAEPFPVPDDSFNPAGIRIGFFDPEPRLNRFEPGRYTPLPGIDAFYGGWSLLPEPPLPLVGNAVTYAKKDAEVAAIRPRPRDPLLAFRDAVRGSTVGAFTTRLPPSYYDSPAGARAVTGWIERLLAHSERDRYGFHLEDRGGALDLRLTLLSKGGALPRVSRITARLEIPVAHPERAESARAEAIPIVLRPDAELAGVFTGTVELTPRPAAGIEARLVLTESGPDALRRPQRLALEIPPGEAKRRVTGDEAWSFGLATQLLFEIASLSGGRVLEPGEEVVLLHGAGTAPPAGELWPWLAGAAILFLLAQVVVRRVLS